MRPRRSVLFLPVLALTPVLFATHAACTSESPSPSAEESAGAGGAGASDAGTPGKATTSGGAGGHGHGTHDGSGGQSGDAGNAEGGYGGDWWTVSCGAGNIPGEAGYGGEPIVAGAGGGPSEPGCINSDGKCAAHCHEIPIVAGCGEEQQSATLCSALPAPATTSCGVRLDDGEVFYVDAPYEGPEYGLVVNPFASTNEYRPCTQAEVDASDCRDHPDEPSTRAAKFVLENNTATDRWVLVAGEPCTAFDIKKDGVSLEIERGDACETSKCRAWSGDWVEDETWQRVPAGASVSLSWDGLSLDPFHTIDVCEPEPEEEVAQPGDSRCREYRQVAAPQGSYAATLRVLSVHPSTNDPDDTTCDGDVCLRAGDVVPIRPVYHACWGAQGSLALEVPFDLPETGEAVITVQLE
jgi:hypothetical protein